MQLTNLPTKPAPLPARFPAMSGSETATALNDATSSWTRSTSGFNLARDELFTQLARFFDAVARSDSLLARSLDAP